MFHSLWDPLLKYALAFNGIELEEIVFTSLQVGLLLTCRQVRRSRIWIDHRERELSLEVGIDRELPGEISLYFCCKLACTKLRTTCSQRSDMGLEMLTGSYD
jgi:hypothetical protein